tara:strand:- start:883 stop:1179 length:297 start_codon:yes stop_codon:yes gene_type:complete
MNKFLIIFLILISCTHPKDKFLEDFGVFVNEVEANYKNFDDTEWEVTQLNFINFREEFEEIKSQMDNYEIDQVNSYIKRFKKVEVRRDPLNNLLEIFK